MDVGPVSEGVNRPWREAVHLRLVERSRMHEALPLLPRMLYGVVPTMLDTGSIIVLHFTQY